MSRPRTVSATGVKGWYSANWRRPAGMVAVDTKALLRKSSSNRIIGVLLAVSTLLAASPSATASQIRAKANRASIPMAANQWSGPALEWNPMREGDPDEDGHSGEGLDQAAEHVAGEHRGPGDGHGAEPVDDAAGHVHGDHDRGALND